MLPLAQLLVAMGARVEGSDRAHDQGRTPEKFAALRAGGVTLWPQDGSGVRAAEQILVASAAVEETVPEVGRAAALGCLRLSRAELLASLFNASGRGVAVAGTSGKSTVTGMIGWILHTAGEAPTIVNGAVMKNFASARTPFVSSIAGAGDAFVSEVDESDGSIALFRPAVGVLLNVSLDHMAIEELRELFSGFLVESRTAVVNADDAEVRDLLPSANEVVTFALDHPLAQFGIESGSERATDEGQEAVLLDREAGSRHALTLRLAGRHNLANAVAAVAAAAACGIDTDAAVAALADFAGIARRFDVLGTSAGGITVIDDFAHNPEKCAATLQTLKARPGRVLAFFQPHGYGPLRQMGAELATVFARALDAGDVVILCDPVYFGGTVDRSEGSERIARLVEEAGGDAEYLPTREECGDWLVANARPGDRIVIMGARDDTLTLFARDLLNRL